MVSKTFRVKNQEVEATDAHTHVRNGIRRQFTVHLDLTRFSNIGLSLCAMDVLIRTTRCRIPRQPLLHYYARRHFSAVSLSKAGTTDRPPHPTAHKTVPEHTRLPQKKPPAPTTVSSPSSPTSPGGRISKPNPVNFRKARMAQVMKEREEGKGLSNEQMLKELEMVTAMSEHVTFDIWAKAIDNLDLYIPLWKDPRKDASLMDHVRAIWNTQVNWFKNIVSLHRMARENSFPGVSVRRAISPELFRIQSTSWLAPFRKTVLNTYLDIQRAVASGDEKTIKKFTVGAHQKRLIDIVRARDPSRVYVWSSEAPAQNEAKVVSIRAFEQHMGQVPPSFGNRLTVQALVRFETMQKLEVYTKKGQLVHSPEPKRVVEYLIFQKRMWYDVPWVVRDQLYEGLQGKVGNL
ncbi:hypothetical protein BXZ70DRAFT_541366 [Cristinia sonorae]|uniref:Tim44-like domain-containing protein n=1 Tax=Cristinia sonorae TaxID=1940300 RepID=A0A8K0XLB1_9AGAR|nr:hypothetical protein BXZ70DRAFT_541366 [Cristinia sonorae]